jgi:preprotein translocase subunit SecE
MATKTSPIQFIQQVRAEVAKVVWPTRREVVLTTIMVFIMAALTSTQARRDAGKRRNFLEKTGVGRYLAPNQWNPGVQRFELRAVFCS